MSENLNIKKQNTRRSGKVENHPKEIKENDQFQPFKIVQLLTWHKKPPMGKTTNISRKRLNIPQNIGIFVEWPRPPLARTLQPEFSFPGLDQGS